MGKQLAILKILVRAKRTISDFLGGFQQQNLMKMLSLNLFKRKSEQLDLTLPNGFIYDPFLKLYRRNRSAVWSNGHGSFVVHAK